MWSSPDGVSWSKRTDLAFPERFGPVAAVLRDELWIIGGRGSAGKLDDFWSSADGVHWTQRSASTPFPSLEGSVGVSFDDQLLLVGGLRNGFANGMATSAWATPDGLSWHELARGKPFSARVGAGGASIKGQLFVAGGLGQTGKLNDVWSSSDGINWQQLTDAAPFDARFHHGLVAHDERLWLIAGSGATKQQGDVWLSDDGATWQLATEQAAFSAREELAAVDFDGRVWVIGGLDTSGYLNDVWWSENGTDWTLATAHAPFSPRSRFALAAYAGKLWVTGGDQDTFDIWTSADGVAWTRETAPAIDQLRGHVLVANTGKLWLAGGRDFWGFNRSIYTFDGSGWQQDTAHAPFPARLDALGLAFDGRTWILAGSENGLRNDVWWR